MNFHWLKDNLNQRFYPVTHADGVFVGEDADKTLTQELNILSDEIDSIVIPSISDEYDSTSSDGMSGKAVASAISGKANIADLPTSYAPTDAEKNIIIGIQKNGTDLVVDSNRKVNITVPTGAAANKAVDSSISASSTSTNLPTSSAVASFVEGKGYLTSFTEEDPTVPSWAKAASKPSYTASEVGALANTVTHLSGDIATSEKGANNGVATLGSDGKIPSSQLPSYVDDVLEYASKDKFPTTGESGKIYVNTADNKTYRWSGTAYVEISPSLALGETSSTAYAGDKGKTLATNLSSHTSNTSNPHGVTKSQVGLGKVGNFKAVSTVASQGLTDTEKSNARANIGAGTSSFSGNYNDLTNKPTIPTVNNATLTIQKNGTNIQTFTANQDSDVTANITVPTKVSDLTNDSGFTSNTGTITGITMNGASKGTSGVVDLGTVITDVSGKLDTAGGTVTGTLVLSRTQDASGTEDKRPALMIGSITGNHLEFDPNEIMAKTDGVTPGALAINHDGGRVTINNKSIALDATSKGSAIKPVYTDADGFVQPCTYTLEKSVPADAKFTDTTYSLVTATKDGLMSASDKKILDERFINAKYCNDFNEALETGFYNCGSTSAVNAPATVSGGAWYYITIKYSGNAVGAVQYASHPLEGDSSIYMRRYLNGTWRAWAELTPNVSFRERYSLYDEKMDAIGGSDDTPQYFTSGSYIEVTQSGKVVTVDVYAKTNQLESVDSTWVNILSKLPTPGANSKYYCIPQVSTGTARSLQFRLTSAGNLGISTAYGFSTTAQYNYRGSFTYITN